MKSLENGRVDVEALKPLLDDTVAGMMMTNPNTLGLFETQIKEITELVHGIGGLMYYDGANMNPLMGVVRPGDMGFDIMHLNLHKTFSTPHGVLGAERQLHQGMPEGRVQTPDRGRVQA